MTDYQTAVLYIILSLLESESYQNTDNYKDEINEIDNLIIDVGKIYGIEIYNLLDDIKSKAYATQ